MPKAKMSSIAGVRVQPKEGSFSILGRDGAGRAVEIELPLSALGKLTAETRRASLTTPRISSIPANAAPGEWGEVVPLDVRTAAVGTLAPPAGPAVAIVFDQGEVSELTFRLPPAGAVELGNLLIKEGEKLTGAPRPADLPKG